MNERGTVITVLSVIGWTALCWGAYQTPAATVAGFGFGCIYSACALTWLEGVAIHGTKQAVTPVQETKPATRELPAGLLPIHEYTTPSFVKPGQSLLDVDPTGQQRETLVVNANGQQVNAIACLVEAGKTHITYIDVAQMEGKPFGSGRNVMYKNFLAELKKLGLAKLPNGQLHLTERGAWGFTHPLTH